MCAMMDQPRTAWKLISEVSSSGGGWGCGGTKDGCEASEAVALSEAASECENSGGVRVAEEEGAAEEREEEEEAEAWCIEGGGSGWAAAGGGGAGKVEERGVGSGMLSYAAACVIGKGGRAPAAAAAGYGCCPAERGAGVACCW